MSLFKLNAHKSVVTKDDMLYRIYDNIKIIDNSACFVCRIVQYQEAAGPGPGRRPTLLSRSVLRLTPLFVDILRDSSSLGEDLSRSTDLKKIDSLMSHDSR